MKQKLAALAVNPMTYILWFSVSGASCVVTGVALVAGAGAAFVAAGAFLLAAAVYLTRGMTPNG
jgi:uncharacterized membrane protein YjjP (DUF1212 family)